MSEPHDEDSDALSWAGDDARGLAPGWTPVGGAGRVGKTDAGASASDVDELLTPSSDVDAPEQTASFVLVVMGVLGGVYLLYAIGWAIVATRMTSGTADIVGGFMFTIGLWLAILAPVAWFAVVLWLVRSPRARVLWLIGGAVLLMPLPFVLGTGVAV